MPLFLTGAQKVWNLNENGNSTSHAFSAWQIANFGEFFKNYFRSREIIFGYLGNFVFPYALFAYQYGLFCYRHVHLESSIFSTIANGYTYSRLDVPDASKEQKLKKILKGNW